MSGREWSSPDLRDMHSDLMRLREHHLGGKRWRDLLHGAADMLLAADAELLATPRTDAGEVERLREALQAQEDADDARDTCECEGEDEWARCGPCSVRFGRAIDLRRAALAPSVGGEGWKTIDSAPKDGTVFWALSDLAGDDLPPFVSQCAWHPSAGFCTDELRAPILWRRFTAPLRAGDTG